MIIRISLFIYFLTSFIIHASSQIDSLNHVKDTIYISSTKIESTLDKATSSIHHINVDPSFSNNVSIQEHINQVPGLFSLNANNYAQDLRISIRGFGSRSSFGIRGVKLIVDGIPETTPDGQGQVDNLNLGIIKNIEVLKGPASVYYGNASGGVVNINTIDQYKYGHFLGNISFGSFGLKRYEIGYSSTFSKTQFLINANHISIDGYRDHSQYESSNLQLKISHDFSKKLKLKINTAYTNSPTAQDPGGITLEDIEEERKAARQNNLTFNAGESIQQYKLGTSLVYQINDNSQINSYSFLSERNFDGLLPFQSSAAIDLERFYWGHGSDLTQRWISNKSITTLKVGYEIARQSDDRVRFNNLEGIRGDTTLNQNESFDNLAFFVLGKSYIGNFSFDLGFRYDQNFIKIKSNFKDDVFQMNSLNPNIGVNYALTEKINLFANYRTGFETPALVELRTTSDTIPKPQRSQNFEAGIRTTIGNNLSFDLTYFKVITLDELVPYNGGGITGVTFYRNAGKTNRTGIELSSHYQIDKNLSFQGHLTISDLAYDDFQVFQSNYEGNKLPGVPSTYGGINLKGDFDNGFGFLLESSYRGDISLYSIEFLENEPSVFLANLKLKFEHTFKTLKIEPYVSLNNIFNAYYSDNIRINAFANNSYEPAPERNFMLGIRFNI